jgi:tripartite-type tricarboxylate transporter receptor subunit TctC
MKQFGIWVLAAVAWAGTPHHLHAQSAGNYPSKLVRVIVPTAPGAATDLQARLLAQKLSESLKRQFVVENRPGAGYLIGYGIVTKADPDGHTLLASSLALTLIPALRPDLPNDPSKDLAPVSLVSKAPFLLLVHPSLPPRTAKDLIAMAKAKPGVFDMGVANGTTTHIVSAYFASAAGIKLTLVPYKGTGMVMVDTMAGQIHMLFGNVLASLPNVRSGRLRALAVSTASRSSVLPEIPTLIESGVPGFDVSTWHGWFAPAGTPAAITSKLSSELAKAVQSPDLKRALTDDGGDPIGSNPEELRKLVATEVPRWRKVVQDSGMRLQ